MAVFSFDIKTSLIGCVICLLLYFIARQRRRSLIINTPPGPSGWPIIGHLLNLDPKTPYLSLNRIAAKYGPVFSLRFGSIPVVVLNSYASVKEAFVKHADEFDDRPRLPMFDVTSRGRGVIQAYAGEAQRLRRRFTIQAMRSLGMGKFQLEEQITEEIHRLVLRFNSHGKNKFCPFADIEGALCNVTCYLAFGKRYEYDDERFQMINRNVSRTLVLSRFEGLGNLFPIFRYLPFGGLHELKKLNDEAELYFADLIKDITENYVEGDPRNYIDMYKDHRAKEAEEHPDFAEKFDDDDLIRTAYDLFLAGTETSATTLQWCLLYLVVNPSKQEKVQSELDTVVGRNRLPTMRDRLSLPYTEAFLLEIQRIASIAPFSGPRAATFDTKLLGYDIPQGTLILPNLWGIHHDESIWEDPHKFNPERFLDDDGRVIRKEELIPFSVGRRRCLGEQLALMELFLFFTHLLHRFKFSLPEGAPSPSLQGIMGATLAPEKFELCAVARSLE